MEQFRQIKINLAAHELQQRLESFQRRSADLTAFVGGQCWSIQTISIDRTNEHRPVVDGNLQDPLALEAMYRRFRFFILNDEPSNYFRLLKLLSAASNDELWHRHLRVERKGFFQSRSLDFAFITANEKYTPAEVINVWFNAYYFHDEAVEREKLAAFEKIVSRDGAKVLLWECVWNSIGKIKSMAWLLRDASPKNPVVYVPVYSRV